jgi:hypothetical protein
VSALQGGVERVKEVLRWLTALTEQMQPASPTKQPKAKVKVTPADSSSSSSGGGGDGAYVSSLYPNSGAAAKLAAGDPRWAWSDLRDLQVGAACCCAFHARCVVLLWWFACRMWRDCLLLCCTLFS